MKKIFSVIALGLVLFFIGAAASPIFAQEVAETSIVSPSSIWYEVWTVVQPIAAVFFTAIAPIVSAFVIGQIMKLIQVTDENKRLEVEAQLRNALHESARNALKFAITKATGTSILGKGPLEQRTLDAAIRYVMEKNPETLEKLQVKPEALEEIIMSKFPDLIAEVNKTLK